MVISSNLRWLLPSGEFEERVPQKSFSWLIKEGGGGGKEDKRREEPKQKQNNLKTGLAAFLPGPQLVLNQLPYFFPSPGRMGYKEKPGFYSLSLGVLCSSCLAQFHFSFAPISLWRPGLARSAIPGTPLSSLGFLKSATVDCSFCLRSPGFLLNLVDISVFWFSSHLYHRGVWQGYKKLGLWTV